MTERFQLRIALLSAEYPPMPGGVGDYTHQLALALTAQGQRVHVLTAHDSRFTIHDLQHPDSTQVSEARLRAPAWGWGSWRAVIGALDAVRPDVLHIQYQTGAYGMHPAINFLPWRLRSLPASTSPALVATAHDLLPPYLFPKAGRLRDWVTRRLLADVDAAVVTNVEDLARLSAARVRRAELIPIGSNIAVAPPSGYDRDAWRARLGVGAGETLVAYFGLISRTKGLETLLDALELLPAQVRLLIVGGEAQAPQDRAHGEAVRRRIAGGPLRERVQITGHCAPDEVSAHLLAADMAALPFTDGASFRRGSLLAALAHGVPVITTAAPRPAAAEAPLPSPRLADGESALLVPPRDPRALAAAIERLTGDRALRERLGEGGRRLAAQFSWETIAAQHIALYRDLLAARANLLRRPRNTA